MRRRRRESTEELGLSFLDCICCGFGAIILLLVLTKIGEPRVLEQAVEDLDGQVARLEEELHEIRGETRVLSRELTSRREQLSEEEVQVARLRGDLSRIQGEFAGSEDLSEISEMIEGRLLAAQQELSEEMKRLQAREVYRRPRSEAPVGGIPVDSEYLIFVIDTSGSMQSEAWPLVLEKMTQTLDAYPTVKGMQVMNDMGQYMFSQYAGKWIPDTPARRKVILSMLASWMPFSNSSPVEGITRAIRTFARSDRKISIFVFGDEFTGSSIEEVLDTVEGLNRRGRRGERQVRIHALGFPVVLGSSRFAGSNTGIRFATLMRALCEANGGTFVGLNTLEPSGGSGRRR